MFGTYSPTSEVDAVNTYRELAWSRVTNREERVVRTCVGKPCGQVNLALRAMGTRYFG
jgi:hypothetical protein